MEVSMSDQANCLAKIASKVLDAEELVVGETYLSVSPVIKNPGAIDVARVHQSLIAGAIYTPEKTAHMSANNYKWVPINIACQVYGQYLHQKINEATSQ
jgi:hypothetical protein